MTAFLSLLALAAPASSDPRLDVAQPAEVLAAVQDCSRAVTGKTRVDHRALEADGWKQIEQQGVMIVRRKPGNAAIILANNGQSTEPPGTLFQEVCFVRASLGSAVTPKAVADSVTGLTGTEPSANKRRRDAWFWRGTSYWVAQDAFDPAADGSPVTQLAVMPVPAWQRPSPDASSQNKNQEPR